MRLIGLALLAAALCLPAVSLRAHGGGTDAAGCHHDRQAGGYHCHSESGGAAVEAPAVEPAFEGRVVSVLDGDTIEILHDWRARRVRLYGVDCPEKRQPFGSVAKKFSSELVFGRSVRVVIRDKDRYGRLVAEIVLEDGRMLNHELVKEGLAWWYRRYAPDDAVLSKLESQARESRRGLWREAEPIAPWAFRRGSPKVAAQ